jgi:hypothetical protein
MAGEMPTDAGIDGDAMPSDGETGARACRNFGKGGWKSVRPRWPERCLECRDRELRNALSVDKQHEQSPDGIYRHLGARRLVRLRQAE